MKDGLFHGHLVLASSKDGVVGGRGCHFIPHKNQVMKFTPNLIKVHKFPRFYLAVSTKDVVLKCESGHVFLKSRAVRGKKIFPAAPAGFDQDSFKTYCVLSLRCL